LGTFEELVESSISLFATNILAIKYTVKYEMGNERIIEPTINGMVHSKDI